VSLKYHPQLWCLLASQWTSWAATSHFRVQQWHNDILWVCIFCSNIITSQHSKLLRNSTGMYIHMEYSLHFEDNAAPHSVDMPIYVSQLAQHHHSTSANEPYIPLGKLVLFFHHHTQTIFSPCLIPTPKPLSITNWHLHNGCVPSNDSWCSYQWCHLHTWFCLIELCWGWK